MRLYLLIVSILFSVMALVHVFVVVEQWHGLAHDPWPAIILALSTGLSIWTWRLRSRVE